MSLYILTFSWGTKTNLFYICFLLSCISFVFCFRVCKSIPRQFFSVWNSNVGYGWWGSFSKFSKRRQGFKYPPFYFFNKIYYPSNRKTNSWNVFRYLIRFRLFKLTLSFVRYRLIYPWMNMAQYILISLNKVHVDKCHRVFNINLCNFSAGS